MRYENKVIDYRDRITAIIKLLYNETDKSNPITTREIRECLELKYGLKTVSKDIHAISENLFPVKFTPHRGGGWYRETEEEHDPERK